VKVCNLSGAVATVLVISTTSGFARSCAYVCELMSVGDTKTVSFDSRLPQQSVRFRTSTEATPKAEVRVHRAWWTLTDDTLTSRPRAEGERTALRNAHLGGPP
jgi:hypothetical protein